MATAISATCFASIFDPCARYVRPSSEAHCQGRQTGATGKLSSSRNCLTASITSGSQVCRSNRAQDQWLGHATWWPCRSAGEGLGFASTKRRFSLHLSWQNQSIRSVQHSHFFLGSSARYSSREPASNAWEISCICSICYVKELVIGRVMRLLLGSLSCVWYVRRIWSIWTRFVSLNKLLQLGTTSSWMTNRSYLTEHNLLSCSSAQPRYLLNNVRPRVWITSGPLSRLVLC